MSYETVIQSISSVGFPIIACCCMFYLYDKTVTSLNSTLVKIESTLDTLSKRIEVMSNEHK